MDDGYKTDIQCNRIMHLIYSMVMYGIYNAETLEKLIETVHHIHNTTAQNESYSQESLARHICGMLISKEYNTML